MPYSSFIELLGTSCTAGILYYVQDYFDDRQHPARVARDRYARLILIVVLQDVPRLDNAPRPMTKHVRWNGRP